MLGSNRRRWYKPTIVLPRFSFYAQCVFWYNDRMRVVYEKAAQTALRKTPAHKREDILEGMECVAQNPYAADSNIKRMKDTQTGYRRRFGDIRVIYELNIKEDILVVLRIGPRGGVYK